MRISDWSSDVCSSDLEVEHVAVDVVDQAAAVEAALGRVAAVAVGRADQADRAHQHGVGGGGVGRLVLRPGAGIDGGSLRWRAADLVVAAAGQQHGPDRKSKRLNYSH